MEAARQQLWHAIPPGVAPVLRRELGELTQEIIAEIRREVPEYERALEGSSGQGVLTAAEEALGHFVELIEHSGQVQARGQGLYLALGRGAVRAGTSLEALLAAYRVGARLAWRRFASAGDRAGLSPWTMYRVAEAIFAYIDELSATSAEGYAREQSAAAEETQRRRRDLAELLVREPGADKAAVQSAARSARWVVPKTVAVLVVRAAEPRLIASRIGSDVLRVEDSDLGCLVIPDPGGPGRMELIERAVEGQSAVLGPAVAASEAHRSYKRAVACERLVVEGLLAGGGLLFAEHHLVDLVLHHDPTLAEDLVGRWLEPLRRLRRDERRRLSQTLLSWLENAGQPTAVGRALYVHPQTVRYRMARLREIYGDALDEPADRFALELALRTAEARSL